MTDRPFFVQTDVQGYSLHVRRHVGVAFDTAKGTIADWQHEELDRTRLDATPSTDTTASETRP